MDPLQTKLGVDIPIDTRGILYLCVYDRRNNSINIVKEILFKNSFNALNAYANIHNPESQLVTGNTYNELIQNLQSLHKRMDNEQWLRDLAEYL
jgi:hypothetical protein